MIQNSMKTKVVGVDIGLERTSYAIVDVRGHILAKDTFQTPGDCSINDFISSLCERVVMLVEENCGYENIRSLGVSVPNGNYMTGNIENAGNLPWKGVIPLAALLRDRLGLAVAVANDAYSRALGEWSYGSAHGMKDFLFITLGYGFGSCLYSNGHPHLGNNGFAGEVGHCCVVPEGRLCSCGMRGCLEAYCATAGILQTAREVLIASKKQSLMRGRKDLTPKMISEFCDQGDELAIEVYRRTGFTLGVGLANYASVVNPEAIIITGGISKAGHWLLEPMDKSFESHVFHNVENKVKILLSSLNDEERNVLGAGALAWRVKEYSLFK